MIPRLRDYERAMIIELKRRGHSLLLPLMSAFETRSLPTLNRSYPRH